jgi:phosphonopyruvate decarboxylase
MMIAPVAFVDALRNAGFDFFTGVPDSLLKDLCAFIDDEMPAANHVITANEGNAVALALGRYLATGRPGVVYMQNSGLGNAVNPILSLASPEVYGIPMLLIVGWRGEPGTKDEPQHVKQGAVNEKMLQSIDVPYWLVDGDSDVASIVAQATTTMTNISGPVTLLVRAGTFSAYKSDTSAKRDFPLGREEALGVVLDGLRPSDTIVSTTGHISRELYEARAARGEGHANDFLTVGGMGHTSSIGLGVALGRPDEQVVCIDGDGSVLMHMGMLPVIGHVSPGNFIHVVLNNGAHESVGGQPTVALDCDLTAIAHASGYRSAISATSSGEVREALDRARSAGGPAFVEVKVRRGARKELGRPKSTPSQNKEALMQRLGSA